MRHRLLMLLVLVLPTLTFAHHSFNATFDPGQVIEIEDTVTRVIWRNPHVRMPTIMEQPYPMEFIGEGDRIVLKIEEYDTVRTIYLDASTAPTGQAESLLGGSIGRWEGSTLVVDTDNSSWRHLDTVGVQLTDAATISERFTPSQDGSHLNYTLTVTNAKMFEAPLVFEKHWLAVPGTVVAPYVCTD